MAVQDRDYWKDRVSVPGEVRKVHKSGKPTGAWRRLALVALLGLGAVWFVQSHNGFGRLAERVPTLPIALNDVRASLNRTLGKLTETKNSNKTAPTADESSEKKKWFYDQIVGFGADAKAGLSIDNPFYGLQNAVNALSQSALN